MESLKAQRHKYAWGTGEEASRMECRLHDESVVGGRTWNFPVQFEILHVTLEGISDEWYGLRHLLYDSLEFFCYFKNKYFIFQRQPGSVG